MLLFILGNQIQYVMTSRLYAYWCLVLSIWYPTSSINRKVVYMNILQINRIDSRQRIMQDYPIIFDFGTPRLYPRMTSKRLPKLVIDRSQWFYKKEVEKWDDV